MSNDNATLNAHPIQYTYQLGDPGPSWEVMKQEVPEYRRPESIQERFNNVTSELNATEALVAEEHDVKLAMRSREKMHLARQIIEWASVILAVVLGAWFAGQWFYNGLH